MISEVARRYAHALFASAQEANQIEKTFDEVREIAKVFSADSTISSFLTSPIVPNEDKAKAIKAAVTGKCSPMVAQFLQVLAEKNRLNIFGEFVEAFQEIADAAHGVTRGLVRSAKPLDASAQKNLEAAIYKATQKKVILQFEEDSALMGGMIASVGGWTFDDSLQMHLHRMTEQLKKI